MLKAQDGISALGKVIHANRAAADIMRQSGEGRQVILSGIDHLNPEAR
jgi:hypothetical protein